MKDQSRRAAYSTMTVRHFQRNAEGKVKKINLSLYLTKHHAMKTY